jgi:MarR family transcriptional regulator, multiple antibiotic resistance protein MarR
MSDIYDPKTFGRRENFGYLVKQVLKELYYAVDRELAPLDMTAAQFSILSHLVHKELDSASGLCKGLDYDPGAMTRMIDRLEAKGLLRRVRSREDRRAVDLELTAEGEAAFPRMEARVVGVLNRFLKGFSKTEARQLEDMLMRMLGNV